MSDGHPPSPSPNGILLPCRIRHVECVRGMYLGSGGVKLYYALGVWVYKHRWQVIFAWALIIAFSMPFAPRVGEVLKAGGFSTGRSEGSRAVRLLQEKLGFPLTTVTVLFSSPDLTVDSPAYQGAMNSILSSLQQYPHVTQVLSYQSTGNRRLVSADRHTTYAIIGFDLGTAAVQRIVPELNELVHSNRQSSSDSITTWITGGPAAYSDIELVSHQDLKRAELVSFPLALIALMLVFGTVVSGLVPALIGGASVLAALAAIFLLGHYMEMSIFVMNVTTMLGLGIGIDYSLIMVSRFREELLQHDVEESVARTVASAGKAVLFSGITVFLGLTGLLVFQFITLRSMGVGGAIVVITSVLAALTLLPAALGVLGHRIDSLPVRWGMRRARGQGGQPISNLDTLGEYPHSSPPADPTQDRLPRGEGTAFRLAESPKQPELGIWSILASWVTRRPWQVFTATLLFLLLLGSPFLRVRMGAPDITTLPNRVSSRQGYDIMVNTFGIGQVSPIFVVLEAGDSIFARDNVGAVYDFVKSMEKKPGVTRVESMVSYAPDIGRGQYQLLYRDPGAIPFPELQKSLSPMAGENLAVINIVTNYNPVSEEAKALAREIRSQGPPDGMNMYVGGAAAELMDLVNELYSTFPKALLLIMVTTYIALLVLFGSVVIPLKAVIMDTLSILASYGALVLIFQDGHFSGLLHFNPAGHVDATVPIVMFCILFGLSMDYEVFMLSRIKEEYEATGDNTLSISRGLERTGGIVTSAAMIILLVSGAFAMADIIVIKALGVGIALAILLDATIVRALLVPATMQLLGDLNWWAPTFLKRGSHPKKPS
ncbi:MAG: MMPL family transporter [Dehalococcoidia bacterium]|nr:MMPL family transporter [Dehalococcoidia bacterium]